MTPVNVVIDTDPGVDDFLAIALALNSPEINIEAFTTTGGNAVLRHTHANPGGAKSHRDTRLPGSPTSTGRKLW